MAKAGTRIPDVRHSAGNEDIVKRSILPIALAIGAFGCTTPAAQPVPVAKAEIKSLGDKSGDRLKIRAERGADGSVRVVDFYFDNTFKEPCAPLCASDGKVHCLPNRASVRDIVYADKDCTQRTAVVTKGRAAPPHAALLSTEPMTGNGYKCEYERQSRIFKMDGEYRESYVYIKDVKGGGCTKVAEKDSVELAELFKHNQIFSVSSEVSPSDFVEITTGSLEELDPAPVAASVALAPADKK